MSTEEVQTKVDKIIEELNPEELSEIMSTMASALLMGQTPVMMDTYVRLSIPKPIHDVVSKVCSKFGINSEEVFSRMASDGFTNSIKTVTGMALSVAEEAEDEEEEPAPVAQPQATQPDLSKVIPGLDKMMAGFGQLNGLVEQLNTMQKVLENAGLADPDNASVTKQNSK